VSHKHDWNVFLHAPDAFDEVPPIAISERELRDNYGLLVRRGDQINCRPDVARPQRAADDLAANRTKRFANTQVMALGAQLVTKPSVTFPAGSLGVYSATGPIPSTDKEIEIARKPVGTVNVLVAQPLSTQYQLHLQLKAFALGVEGTRQDQEKMHLEIVDLVRRAYFDVVEAQSALDSLRPRFLITRSRIGWR
jgi:hypothetical protein